MRLGLVCRDILIQSASHRAHKRSQIVGNRPDPFRKEGIDFCTQDQNHGKVVEENDENSSEPDSSSQPVEKMGGVQGKQQQVNLQGDRRFYCS